MADRFLIAPLEGGLQTDIKPFLIPDDAFVQMFNCYNFRSRIRKRFGARFLNESIDPDFAQFHSRLRVEVGEITGGTLAGMVPGAIFNKIGHAFTIDDIIFTVFDPAAGPQQMYRTDGSVAVATYDVTTGNFDIQGVARPDTTKVYWYPAEPVMGFSIFEQSAINQETTLAFDTQFAYRFVNGAWERITMGTDTWTGSNSDFFWGTTWRGVTPDLSTFFVVNYVTADGIRYLNALAGPWATLSPKYLPDSAPGPPPLTNELKTCLIIVPFRDHLVALNTVETVAGAATTFRNRARWSKNGSPFDADAWRQDSNVIGIRGGYNDAPTKEAIITASLIRDRLIVGFERSTYELAWTGNKALPFRWVKLNSELGAESTFSVVNFDKHILTVGNVGIHACNGTYVERIDNKIPDEVFRIHNNNDGVKRVAGVRDFFTEMVYWTLPDPVHEDLIYPNRVLVYNYKNGNWAINDDAITAFGYFQTQTVDDSTWGSDSQLWSEDSSLWSGLQEQIFFRNVIAGNQEGYTFIIDPDSVTNTPALQITNITILGTVVTITAIDHNFLGGDAVRINGVVSDDGVDILNGRIYIVTTIDDKDTFEIVESDIVGTDYKGGGSLERISAISFKSKDFNPYIKEGRNVSIRTMDFYVDSTAAGKIQVNWYSSSSIRELRTDGQITGALIGTGVLDTSPYTSIPYEATQERFWHPVYIQAEGDFVSFELIQTLEMLTDPNVADNDFQLHAIAFIAEQTAHRLI